MRPLIVNQVRMFASKYSFDDGNSAKSGSLYSDHLNPEERKLAVMTTAAALELDEREQSDGSRGLIQ